MSLCTESENSALQKLSIIIIIITGVVLQCSQLFSLQFFSAVGRVSRTASEVSQAGCAGKFLYILYAYHAVTESRHGYDLTAMITP